MSLFRNGFSSFTSTFTASAVRRVVCVAALVALFVSMQATWRTTPVEAKPAAAAAPATAKRSAPPPELAEGEQEQEEERPARGSKKELSGKLNLNTASEEQLQLLPTVGPAKAERIVAWRKKNGSFKRPADLRKVKGFGYKTLKRLEPYLDISGETTLAEK
jgi:competence ComEA-like helix-hairpin-helix protein